MSEDGPAPGFPRLKGSFHGLWVGGGNLECHRRLINKVGFIGRRHHR